MQIIQQWKYLDEKCAEKDGMVIKTYLRQQRKLWEINTTLRSLNIGHEIILKTETRTKDKDRYEGP